MIVFHRSNDILLAVGMHLTLLNHVLVIGFLFITCSNGRAQVALTVMDLTFGILQLKIFLYVIIESFMVSLLI